MVECGGAERVKFGQRDAYVIANPTMETITSLPTAKIEPNTPSPPNGTSLFGMKSLLTTLKVLTLFLSTHTYPAFAKPDDKDAYGYDVDAYLESISTPEQSHRYTHDLLERYKECGVSEDALKKNPVLDGETLLSETADIYTSMGDMVVVAKPAPFRPLINVGKPTDIPALPGFLFPYFSGCLIPEAGFLPDVMATFFLGCLGDTKERATEGFKAWNKGFDKWYKTESGKQLQHVFLGIKLALQSQSRLFLIQSNGSYGGFALLGYKFSLLIDGIEHTAESPEGLRKLAVSLDDHSAALIAICELFKGKKGVVVGRRVPQSINPSTVQGTRHLHWIINSYEELEGDELEELERNWPKIAFPERFWQMTHHQIARAVDLFNSDTEIENDLPMFLPPNLLYVTDRPTLVLSVFGPMAPSFLDSRGTEFSIPYPGEADEASSLDSHSGRMSMEFILVSGKKLEAAIDDFRSVVKRRRVRQNIGERAVGFRTMKFGGEARELIWSALKKLKGEKPEPVAGKKRGRSEGPEGSGESAAKKLKQREDVAAAFAMDDF
jgi:hypothetical protein